MGPDVRETAAPVAGTAAIAATQAAEGTPEGPAQTGLAGHRAGDARSTAGRGLLADDDGWVRGTDLFDEILAHEPEERLHVDPADQAGGLRDFFAADGKDQVRNQLSRLAGRTEHGRRPEDGWPDNNYGPAFWQHHARRRRDRHRLQIQQPREGLWEVDDLVEPLVPRETGVPGPSSAVHSAAASTASSHSSLPVPSATSGSDAGAGALPAWRQAPTVGVRDDPTGWLDALDEAAPAPRTTARLLGLAAGDPVERWTTVAEVSETLFARPRHAVVSPRSAVVSPRSAVARPQGSRMMHSGPQSTEGRPRRHGLASRIRGLFSRRAPSADV